MCGVRPSHTFWQSPTFDQQPSSPADTRVVSNTLYSTSNREPQDAVTLKQGKKQYGDMTSSYTQSHHAISRKPQTQAMLPVSAQTTPEVCPLQPLLSSTKSFTYMQTSPGRTAQPNMQYQASHLSVLPPMRNLDIHPSSAQQATDSMLPQQKSTNHVPGHPLHRSSEQSCFKGSTKNITQPVRRPTHHQATKAHFWATVINDWPPKVHETSQGLQIHASETTKMFPKQRTNRPNPLQNLQVAHGKTTCNDPTLANAAMLHPVVHSASFISDAPSTVPPTPSLDATPATIPLTAPVATLTSACPSLRARDSTIVRRARDVTLPPATHIGCRSAHGFRTRTGQQDHPGSHTQFLNPWQENSDKSASFNHPLSSTSFVNPDHGRHQTHGPGFNNIKTEKTTKVSNSDVQLLMSTKNALPEIPFKKLGAENSAASRSEEKYACTIQEMRGGVSSDKSSIPLPTSGQPALPAYPREILLTKGTKMVHKRRLDAGTDHQVSQHKKPRSRDNTMVDVGFRHLPRGDGGTGKQVDRGGAGPAHDPSKRFCCQQCPTRFDRKGHLRVHVDAVHNKQRPYICPLCSVSFGHSSSQVRHIKSRHGLSMQNIKAMELSTQESREKQERSEESSVPNCRVGSSSPGNVKMTAVEPSSSPMAHLVTDSAHRPKSNTRSEMPLTGSDVLPRIRTHEVADQ